MADAREGFFRGGGSGITVPVFHALFPAGFSKQNGTGNPATAAPQKSLPCRVEQKEMLSLHFLIPSIKQEWHALPGLSLPPRAFLPLAGQNLFQKMVVFLIVPKERFMTALGGVV